MDVDFAVISLESSYSGLLF